MVIGLVIGVMHLTLYKYGETVKMFVGWPGYYEYKLVNFFPVLRHKNCNSLWVMVWVPFQKSTIYPHLQAPRFQLLVKQNQKLHRVLHVWHSLPHIPLRFIEFQISANQLAFNKHLGFTRIVLKTF